MNEKQDNIKTDWRQRTELLLGQDTLAKFTAAHVLVVGIGGVGAFAAEFLGRAGIGSMTLVDGDVIEHDNRNRQLLATRSSEGQSKVELMRARLLDINPEINIVARHEFIRDEAMIELLKEPFDYVVDAIDTLSPKVYLAAICLRNNLPIVSAMGAGGKVDPCQIQVADIEQSYNCKLARAMRKRLHRMGIRGGFKVVFSAEKVNAEAVITLDDYEKPNHKSTVGTISYLPAVFGATCASVVLDHFTLKS